MNFDKRITYLIISGVICGSISHNSDAGLVSNIKGKIAERREKKEIKKSDKQDAKEEIAYHFALQELKNAKSNVSNMITIWSSLNPYNQDYKTESNNLAVKVFEIINQLNNTKFVNLNHFKLPMVKASIFAPKVYIKEVITSLKSLDKELTKTIKFVANISNKGSVKYLKEKSAISKRLGGSTSDVEEQLITKIVDMLKKGNKNNLSKLFNGLSKKIASIVSLAMKHADKNTVLRVALASKWDYSLQKIISGRDYNQMSYIPADFEDEEEDGLAVDIDVNDEDLGDEVNTYTIPEDEVSITQPETYTETRDNIPPAPPLPPVNQSMENSSTGVPPAPPLQPVPSIPSPPRASFSPQKQVTHPPVVQQQEAQDEEDTANEEDFSFKAMQSRMQKIYKPK